MVGTVEERYFLKVGFFGSANHSQNESYVSYFVWLGL